MMIVHKTMFRCQLNLHIQELLDPSRCQTQGLHEVAFPIHYRCREVGTCRVMHS